MAAFVLGNGTSRQEISIDQLLQLGSVYACNGVYRTHAVTALIATDHPISKVIQESGYSKINRFYTRRPITGLGAEIVPKPYFGFSSGPIATAVAAMDKNTRIYLLGFDMGPDTQGKFNNVFAGTDFYKDIGAAPTYTGNWVKQLTKVIQDFPNQKFIRVIGATTASISELATVKNLEHMLMTSFLERINNEKDL
jgi:hypothetical protein